MQSVSSGICWPVALFEKLKAASWFPKWFYWGSFAAYQYHRTVSKTLPHGGRYTFGSTTMNKESACIMICIVSKKCAKTLDLKRKFDITLWRHKQRTPSSNDHHTPLISNTYWRKRGYIISFAAPELPTFWAKRFNLQNVLNFNITWPWPVKNSTVTHRLRKPGVND